MTDLVDWERYKYPVKDKGGTITMKLTHEDGPKILLPPQRVNFAEVSLFLDQAYATTARCQNQVNR